MSSPLKLLSLYLLFLLLLKKYYSLSGISVSLGVIFIDISIEVLMWMDTLIPLLSFLESQALALMKLL